MKGIAIYPENKEQLQAVKSILKVLKERFEQQHAPLTPHVIDSIKKISEQAKKKETIDLAEFKKKHFLKDKG